MARSLKKGPFADESLLKKVDAMNAAGDLSQKIWLFTNQVNLQQQEHTEDMVKTKRNQDVKIIV